MTINLKSNLIKATVELKDNSFPTVDQAKKEADKSFNDLIKRQKKL